MVFFRDIKQRKGMPFMPNKVLKRHKNRDKNVTGCENLKIPLNKTYMNQIGVLKDKYISMFQIN